MLGASGLAIDVVRAAIDPGAPAVRWPLGITAPAGFGPGRTLIALAAVAFALATLRALVVYGTASAVGKLIHVDLVPELRARVFAKLQRLPLRFFARNPSGAIINRVTADVQSVRAFIDGVLVQGALMSFALCTYVAYMARVHVGLLAACLAPTPLILLATLRFSRWARPAYEANRALSDAMVLALSEGVKGMRVTKTFGAEAHELERFRGKNRAVRDQQEQIFRRVSRLGPTVSFVTAINVAILLLYGGALVAAAGDDAGAAGRVRRAAAAVLDADLGHGGDLQHAGAERDRRAPRVRGAGRAARGGDAARRRVALPAGGGAGEIRFEGVSFAYDRAAPALVLAAIDLTIAPGRCVAFVGATGAGKSTLLALVPRFYDPNAGRVLIDGVDVRRLDLDGLRRSVGFVFQESVVFSGTIADNIAFGDPGAQPRRDRARRAHRGRARLHRRAAGRLRHASSRRRGTTCPAGSASGWRSRAPSSTAADPAAGRSDQRRRRETEAEVLAAIEQARAGRTTLLVDQPVLDAAASPTRSSCSTAAASSSAARTTSCWRPAASTPAPRRCTTRRSRRWRTGAPRRSAAADRRSGRSTSGSSAACSATRGRTRACATR